MKEYMQYDEYNQDRIKKEIVDMYSLFNAIPKEKGEKLIQTIFPTIGKLMGGYYEYKTYSELRRRGRICTNDFFDSYFQMSFDDDEILNSKMKLYIYEMSSKENFRTLITELIENKKIDRFLDRLQDFIIDIPEKDFQNIFNILIDLGDNIPEKKEQFFIYNNYKKVANILNLLSHKLESKDDRFKLYKDAIIKSKNSIWISCWIMQKFMGEHGEIEGFTKKTQELQTISQENLKELKNLVKLKIQDWVEKYKLFECKYEFKVYYTWLKLDKIKAQSYKIKQLEDNQQLLKIIEKDIVTTDNNISFNYEGFKKFIEPLELNDIAQRVKDIYKDLDFYEHTEETKKNIKQFLEQYEKETIKNNKSS
jgi:hypothetical protein